MSSGKVLVTGGTGFVGSNLVEALVDRKYDVRCLVREGSRTSLLKNLRVELVYGDIKDKASLPSALKDVTTVFHLAGILGKWGVPNQVYWDIHVTGTRLLLESCVERGVRRFIYCSSAGVLGPIKKPPADESCAYAPSNAYEYAKAEAEKLVLSYKEKLDVTIVRPEFIYGPKDKHVLGLFRSIKNRRFFIIGDGKALLHPTYIEDLNTGFILCLENHRSIGEVYLIVGERYVTVEDLVNIICQNLGQKTSWIHIPTWIAKVFAEVSEFVGKVLKFEPPLTYSKVKFFTENRAFTYSKAERDLRYKPVKLADGIEKTIKWYYRNGYLKERAPLEKLYQIAFVEGEGIGTAYEYFVKWRLLEGLFKLGIENILILGLPEKYGTSMDFVLLADQHDCRVTIVDERSKNLDKCRKALDVLRKRDFIREYPQMIKVEGLSRFQSTGDLDLVLCSEVLQRLSERERHDYLRNTFHMTKYVAMFVPNKENKSHARISRLESLTLDELLNLFGGYLILDKGYIDLPPFPPGLKMTKRSHGGESHNAFKDRILIKTLDQWSRIEKFSNGLRSSSHIVFVIAGTDSGGVPSIDNLNN
jgi:nucleoside-diphosphate-sugar epimerase